MGKLLALGVVLLLGMTLSLRAEKEEGLPDLDRMVDVVCGPPGGKGIETSDHAAPDGTPPHLAFGDGGASLGKCQIKIRTALTIGGLKPTEGFPALGDEERSRKVARTIFGWCAHDQFDAKGRRTHEARRTPLGLGACYNGPSLGYPPPLRVIMAAKDKDGVDWSDRKKLTYTNLRLYAEKVDKGYRKIMLAQR